METHLSNTKQQDLPQQQKIVEPFIVTITKQERGPNKIMLGLFGIVIFFFSAFLGYVLLIFSNKQMIRQSIIQPAIVPVSQIPTLLFEATQQTKVATTLDVPELYKSWIWSIAEQSSSNENLIEIKADKFNKKYLPIPLTKGKMYSATSSIISNPDVHFISNYYAIQLLKSGWVPQGNDPYLTFQSFRLQANTMDGPCDGLSGYIGYKDGMVRLVSVAHSVKPCISSTKVQNNTVTIHRIEYTVFISDPVSVRSLSDYFVSHMKQ